MAATIKNIYVCPRCEEGIVTNQAGSTVCPTCGMVVGPSQTAYYKPPLTLHEQHQKLCSDSQHLNVIIELTQDKTLGILQDALNILETVAVKKLPVAGIRPIVEIGMKIGAIASAYDAFLQAGGAHVPGVHIELDTINKSNTENQNELQKTRTGKITPAGSPEPPETR